MPVKMRRAAEAWDAISARCVWVGECFVWPGANNLGYGVIKVDGKQQYVHRLTYAHFKGPIPEGLHIDHVRARGCTSSACCNIAHLEAVTPVENQHRSHLGFRRGESSGKQIRTTTFSAEVA